MINGEFRIGKWRVEPQSGQLETGGRRFRVQPKVMELLAYFVRNPGQVLSKDHLLEALWNGVYVTESTLMNTVSELRKALGDDRKTPVFIETLPKRGYRLIAPVTRPEPEASVSAVAPKRLVVLPFEDFSGRAAEKHLAEVITVLIADALTQYRWIRVISRISSTAVGQGASMPLPEIARRLEAERILEGSLLSSQDALDLVVRLYNQMDEILWTDVFGFSTAGERVDLKQLARQIAERVARSEGERP